VTDSGRFAVDLDQMTLMRAIRAIFNPIADILEFTSTSVARLPTLSRMDRSPPGLVVSCLVVLSLTSHFSLARAADVPPARLLNDHASTADVASGQVRARYALENEKGVANATMVRYAVTRGATAAGSTGTNRWVLLHGVKENGDEFRVWLQADGEGWRTPGRGETTRYIYQRGASVPLEYRNPASGRAVLPSTVAWPLLWPRSDDAGPQRTAAPQRTFYLGNWYRLEGVDQLPSPLDLPSALVVTLRSDMWVGVASNTRQVERTRRFDGSEYQLVRLTRRDYRQMAEAGINCMKVDREQLSWVEDLRVYYWGVEGGDLPYPECLYDSRYLGPTLFLDEPAVHTRDYIIRPRLAKDPSYRQSITPQSAFDAFRESYDHAWREGPSTRLCHGLKNRPDAHFGEWSFLQENLFSWETMVSTAAYQLSQSPTVPAALVFEPPGRVGVRRTLPEFDMSYGCQIPTDNPNYFTDIIYGFLRGAARLTGKQWGVSIYGAVDRGDAPGFLTRAYDLGATRFFFWDNAQLACVPYDECLGLARILKMRAENQPPRDLEALKRAAPTVILLPAGYNLGHVAMGKGNLWGLGELNLERRNSQGVTHRTVMANLFTEIERCLRLGVTFDVLGEFPGVRPEGYRETIRIREDGKIEVTQDSAHAVLDGPRIPARPPGLAPVLNIYLSASEGKSPLTISARAIVTPTSAPVYYTFGTDSEGVYRNAVVAWEVYGPGAEDHRFIIPPGLKPRVTQVGTAFEVQVEFRLEQPGEYRLRAATVDTAGRSTVNWIPLRAY
jgi:hypothetical protein